MVSIDPTPRPELLEEPKPAPTEEPATEALKVTSYLLDVLEVGMEVRNLGFYSTEGGR